MKAIVLTYDKYKTFSDHMINCYQNLWPGNSFIFRIPYQSEEIKNYFENKYGEKVEMIKTHSGIVQTINTLLEGFNDNDWVFWCMDDRYPISLKTDELAKIHTWIESPLSENISGLMYVNSPWGRIPKNLFYYKHRIENRYGHIFLRRKGYRMIWIHQYLRVKVIRTLFLNFSYEMKNAKEMDYILYTLSLPDEQKLYALNHNIGVYGESTSRGMLTTNCVSSLTKYGFEIPPNFKVSDKRIIQGTNTIVDDLLYYFKDKIKNILGIKSIE